MPMTDRVTTVYVSNADSREISVLHLDSTGALAPVERVPVAGTVMPLAVSPDRRYLYASLRSAPFTVAAFAIDQATGRLTALANTALPDNMCYLATDRTGRFLLAASYTGDKITVSSIGADGAVAAQPVEVIATARHAHSIVTGPSNHQVFAAVLGGDEILQYRFDPASGALTPNQPPFVATKSGSGPRHLVFHPSGCVVYASNELDGTVNSYRFDTDAGTLARVASASVLPADFDGTDPATSDLRVTPGGDFLYVAERTSSTLAGFRVDGATGTLDSLGHTPTETQPRGFAIDPHGRFLVAAGQQSDSLTSYAIDPDSGALTPLHRCPVGRNPNWVDIVELPAS
jgi:6-phosphogluconolactonase